MARGPSWLYGLAGLANEPDPWKAGGGLAFWTRGKQTRPSPAMTSALTTLLISMGVVGLALGLIFPPELLWLAIALSVVFLAFGVQRLRLRYASEEATAEAARSQED